MTNHQHWLLLKILPYPLISAVTAFIYWLLEIGFLSNASAFSSSTSAYNPANSLIGVMLMAVTLGTCIGTIEETVFKTRFYKRPFLIKIGLKIFIYITLLLGLLFVLSLTLGAVNLDQSIFDEASLDSAFAFFTSVTILGVVTYIAFMVGLGLLFSEIIDYLGIDVVGSFFTGKYNKSVIEERIFMFLDMKDSTTIAEKLGHEKHYEFINEYYGDMTNAIIETRGRIYQYVGDEIILSWSLTEGLNNANCLNCFYLIKKALQSKADIYQRKYGVAPGFKAALHYGKVTRGQVGFIKKELLFTGDVLNTTARIQSMCKKLNADFLMSNTLRRLISDTNFEFVDKGSFTLRGRKKEETLVEVLSR